MGFVAYSIIYSHAIKTPTISILLDYKKKSYSISNRTDDSTGTQSLELWAAPVGHIWIAAKAYQHIPLFSTPKNHVPWIE